MHWSLEPKLLQQSHSGMGRGTPILWNKDLGWLYWVVEVCEDVNAWSSEGLLPLCITKWCHYENIEFNATKWRVLDRLCQDIQTLTWCAEVTHQYKVAGRICWAYRWIQSEKDVEKKADLMDQSFDCYMAYLLLYNSDQAKYRSGCTDDRYRNTLSPGTRLFSWRLNCTTFFCFALVTMHIQHVSIDPSLTFRFKPCSSWRLFPSLGVPITHLHHWCSMAFCMWWRGRKVHLSNSWWTNRTLTQC